MVSSAFRFATADGTPRRSWIIYEIGDQSGPAADHIENRLAEHLQPQSRRDQAAIPARELWRGQFSQHS